MSISVLNRTAFLLSLDPGLRQFATPHVKEELVPWTYYSRQTMSAGAQATSTPFFNSVPTDSRSGNMELAQQVPSPKRFLVTQIRVHCASIAASAVYGKDNASPIPGRITNAINLFTADGQVDFSLGDKKYLRVPVWKLPDGGGLSGFGDTFSDDGGTPKHYYVQTAVSNGRPVMKNGMAGAWPIPCNTAFSVSLLMPGANTTLEDVVITISLDGWLIRPTQ